MEKGASPSHTMLKTEAFSINYRADTHYSLWYVKSGLSASDAGKKVWSIMDSNDSLIVIDATNNDASWYNLGQEVSDFIKKHWHN